MASPPSPLVDAFGRAVRRRRRDRELSQQALAARADVSFRHLGEIERGNREPRLVTIFKLLDALEMSPAEQAMFWDEVRRRSAGAR